ncbi:MAG: ATP-binding protein [Pirellulales bacterium]
MRTLRDCLFFIALFILPLLLYPAVHASGWRSSSDVHALLEFASSLLAVTAGIMVLLHFFTTGRLFFLIISIGFIQIGTEEFVHAIFSFGRLLSDTPQTLRFAISTTWLTGQFLLAGFFLIAIVLGDRVIVPEKRGLTSVVYNVAGLICAGFVALLVFNSPHLSDVVQLGSTTKQLVEISLAALFLVAFLLYFNIYLKQPSHSPLLWSIVACIIFRVLVHIFVFDARAFYDAHWDTAHLLVFLSYFFPIFGVWGETMKLHKSSQLQLIELGSEMAERKRAEESLRESEERFRTLFEQAAVGVAQVESSTGRFVRINQKYCDIVGFEPGEMTAKTFMAITHPDDVAAGLDAMKRLVEGRIREFSLEKRYYRKEGGIVWVHLTVSPMWAPGEPPNHHIAVVEDITVRKQAEQALFRAEERLALLHRIENVFLTVPDEEIYHEVLTIVREALKSQYGGFSYLDEDGTLVAPSLTREVWDPCQIPDKKIRFPRETWGSSLWGRAVLEKRTLCSNQPSHVPEGHLPIERVLAAPVLYQGEVIALFEVANKPTDYGEEDRELLESVAMAIAPAIHARLQKDRQEKKRRKAEADREALVAQLEAKNAEMERFVYVISHELKSPLVTASCYLGLLKEHLDEHNDEGAKSDMARIGAAAVHMHQLLGELLELCRIGRVVTPSVNVSLSDLAQEAVELASSRIAERNVRVEIAADPPLLYGDRARLLQVFENLVSNAVKFMGDQADPRIEIGARRDGGEAVYYVRDNGIGLDPRYLERVFRLFERLEPGIEGTGVGLAIVKQIIELHGGRIWVESEGPGHGSTFCFTLPGEPEPKSEENHVRVQ